MIPLETLAAALHGTWLSQPLPPDTPLLGGAFDTRHLDGAQIFFALAGEQSDGHEHLPKLAGSTVRLAVVSRPVEIPGFDGAVLQVPDTLAALAAAGAAMLARHKPRVVAITGSYGKTTAKELTAQVLRPHLPLLHTEGSFNNEIGVPITLLRLDGSQRVAVLEYSARKPGDIDYLCRIAPPDVAVLLNVGTAHIGVFGTREAIYRTKGEIFAHLRPGGTAIVGAEDARLAQIATGHGVPPEHIVRCGAGGDFAAEDEMPDGEGCLAFTGVRRTDGDAVQLPLRAGFPGPHGPQTLLFAWAVAHALGLQDDQAAPGLSAPLSVKGRGRTLQAPGGATVIDDTYNSSATPVVNLIRLLGLRRERRKLLVLGPLGEAEEDLTASAAEIAPHLAPPLTGCIVYDARSGLLARRLREQGAALPLRVLSDLDVLIGELRSEDMADTVIGIKGARSAHMERAVEGLLGTRVTCRLAVCGLLLRCPECPRLSGA